MPDHTAPAAQSGMIGRTYLERGQPVVVVVAWRAPSKACPLPSDAPWLRWLMPPRGAPRNVLIERADGSRVVRPFRGLRRPR